MELHRQLTFRSVKVRPVLVPLARPVVSRVGHFDRWPLILIDLETEEGIVGRSYLEPYLKDAARYIVPAVHDLARQRIGKPIRPLDDFQSARKALNLVGYEGLTMIAIAGLDMAAWDALAKAAGLAPGRIPRRQHRARAGLQQQRPVAHGCGGSRSRGG